jgi:hypothetical protein
MKIKSAGRIFLVLVVSAMLSTVCGSSREKTAASSSKTVSIWRKYERDFERGVNGHQGNNEFDKACLFFEQTTGLTMHVNDSTIGTLPTPETRQDLVRIRAWYKVNKNRLYWDESTHTVKVRPSHGRFHRFPG